MSLIIFEDEMINPNAISSVSVIEVHESCFTFTLFYRDCYDGESIQRKYEYKTRTKANAKRNELFNLANNHSLDDIPKEKYVELFVKDNKGRILKLHVAGTPILINEKDKPSKNKKTK